MPTFCYNTTMNEDIATDSNSVVRESATPIFDRMFGAVEKVRERLERSCKALEQDGVPYAVVGGNAVAAWVATIDDGAVRNTRDVDILLRAEDLDCAEAALKKVGFHRDSVMDVVVFLDGPDGKPSQGIHILLAEKKVRPEYSSPTPRIDQYRLIDGRRVVELEELVRMKLNSYRIKDMTHLMDMIQVGLIDASWPSKFESSLGVRLQELLDNPEG